MLYTKRCFFSMQVWLLFFFHWSGFWCLWTEFLDLFIEKRNLDLISALCCSCISVGDFKPRPSACAGVMCSQMAEVKTVNLGMRPWLSTQKRLAAPSRLGSIFPSRGGVRFSALFTSVCSMEMKMENMVWNLMFALFLTAVVKKHQD